MHRGERARTAPDQNVTDCPSELLHECFPRLHAMKVTPRYVSRSYVSPCGRGHTRVPLRAASAATAPPSLGGPLNEERKLLKAGAGLRRDLPFPVVPAQDKAEPARKKPRFPGLSCERGTGLEPATLSLGS